MVIVAIAINVFALISALMWQQNHFLGTLFYPGLVVTDTYNPDWQAHKLGMQTGDRVLEIDNVSVSTGRDLFLLLGTKKTTDVILLSVERSSPDNSSNTLSIPLTIFAWEDFFIFFWLPYIIGIIYLVLGIIVYRLRGVERGSDIFATFCIFSSILGSGVFDHYTFHFLTPLWAIIFPLTGAVLLHLAFAMPKQTRLLRRKSNLRFIPYGIALVLGLANLYSFYFSPDPRLYLVVKDWMFIFVSLTILAFLALQLNARLSTLSSLIRQQTTIIFWGSLISFGPIAIWKVATLLGVQPSFIWPIFTGIFIPLAIFPVMVAYAMLRYRLLDLDVIFNRGVVYSLITLIVTLIYFLIVSFLGALFRDSTLFSRPIILAIFVLILVIAFEPLKQRLHRTINRLFMRESFDYRQLLQSYGRSLISTPLNTDHILQMLVKQAEEALLPENAVVFLRDSTHGTFAIRYQKEGNNLQTVEVQFGLSDDLAQWLADTNNILQLTPSGAPPAGANISQEELARLNMLNISLCVPMLGSENLLGWLALGLKKSGQPYVSNDLFFLATLSSQTTIALENAQLLEEANRRAEELEALQKLSVDIQTETESDTLLTSVLERAIKLLQAEGGLVYLLEANTKTLKAVVSYNLDQDYTGYTLNIPEGVAGRAAALGETVVVDNYHNFAGRSKKFQTANFGAVLGVPLRWGGKVRGVLNLVHRPQGLRFSESDVWLMELFASQSAIALEQSRLLNEARNVAKQLAILSEVSIAISSTLDLDTALQRVMGRAVDLLNAEAGSLLLMDQAGKNLIFEVVLGPTGEDLLGVTIPVGKGIVGTVAESGVPLIINDVSADPRWNIDFDADTDFQTKDLLCVPMVSHNRVVGVVEILNKQDGSIFDQDDCSLLMAFGAQAAIAIENAQIFTRTDQALAERVQELQTLQMFDQQLQTSLELNTVLDVALSYAMDSLGVSMGVMGIIKKEDDVEAGLYLLTQRGMPMEMARYKIDPWALNKGIMGQVIQTGEARLINDITQVNDYIPKTHRTRSLLAVPIMREGQVIGIMNLESTELDYFTEDDLSFVNILVSHAALVIENAQLFEQVNQANEDKSEFMSTASHELKIPMTSIKGYAKLLQIGAVGALTDQQTEFLKIISSNVDRMDRLVADLLDVSRIEAGRIKLQLEDVQVEHIISDVIESVQTQIKDKKLNLELLIDNNLPVVRADYGRMVQIVTNLVSNAYKYTPEGGDITVIATLHNGTNRESVAVTVKDTGYGISEEDQSNLFTTFFRSSDQNIRDEPGTGLGLSITKKMIESHGGELTFESAYGQGTTFTFTIPLLSEIPSGIEVVE